MYEILMRILTGEEVMSRSGLGRCWKNTCITNPEKVSRFGMAKEMLSLPVLVHLAQLLARLSLPPRRSQDFCVLFFACTLAGCAISKEALKQPTEIVC